MSQEPTQEPTQEENEAALGRLSDNELGQAAGGAFNDAYWQNSPIRASINPESPIVTATANPIMIQSATINPPIIQSATINPPIP